MNNERYKGPFKEHIHNHVALKQAVGYKYETDAAHLERFDRFIQEKYPEATVLTKEMVLDWCSKKAHESQANQCSRASIIRQFGLYLDTIGVAAYLPARAKNLFGS
jgi:integrase/recombinase XerD